MSAVAPVLPGETLGDGKYRVERILGQGGMGIVVAAKHIALEERVAIKFLLGDPGGAAVERFLREARAAVKVKGEHVCRVLDFGRLETGEPYIVMEYLEGTDLAKVIERGGAQKPSAAVGWIVEACDALAEAHAIGIVHRDIKPANIFLAKRGDDTTVAKVLDFGISKLPSQTQDMTGTQTTMGSPSYMSPEQMESARDVDARTDVWSLGVTLYELLMGKPPFVADSMVQLTVAVREKEPPPLDGVASGLADIVLKCLAKDREDRYPSVSALVSDLAAFAPEEVLGIVRRQAKRDSLSGGAAAFAATALESRSDAKRLEDAADASHDPEKNRLTEGRAEKTGEKGIGKGTFAPVQSTVGERAGEPRRRSAPLLLVGAAILAGVAIGGVVLSRSTSLTAPGSASPEAAVSTPIKEDPSMSTTTVRLPPSPPLTGGSTSSVAASVAYAASASSGPPAVVPKPTPPPTSVAPKAFSSVLGTPVTAVPAISSVAPSATPATKPEPKKRRDLDRDDP